ncbi:MAG: type I-B CRISPR-associated endonuclease Cas1b [Bacteroidales bacterium]|jgi:CRISPR-associated protein Cas1|nr:type I-B CRISPR-associated endonuclease Cas1b [Bacteroidales bacterium]
MKKTYYLFNPGILERKDNTLKFTPLIQNEADENSYTEGDTRYIPVENVSEFYVFGSLRANSSLYNFLGQSDIAVHFFDYYENYTGSFMPRDFLLSGRMLLAQTEYYRNDKARLVIAQKFIDGASFNMIKNLQYYNRRGKDLEVLIDMIRGLAGQIYDTKNVKQLMGVEGNIRQLYYEAFNLVLNDFQMGARTKQPPRNEVNALISFGNMMCYSQCLRAIHQTQLNPTISYLHSPGERRYSLSLDISEIFKPVIVDRVIFKVLNKKMIQERHFDRSLNKCLLNETGKKIFVKEIEERLNETISHRSLKRNVSYRYLIRLECYKLSKHLLGIEEYKPFKMYW